MSGILGNGGSLRPFPATFTFSSTYMYTFLASVPQKEVFETLASTIAEMGFTVVGKDENRPWGGFFVIEEAEAPLFIEVFFPH
ncbi:MAG TPA: hypothetical protein PLL64_06000, partial [Rhodothermales bacterium]|nr:hypothetical protein [Rhodothermales bacterium]